jgi:hypothetical protein
VTRGVVGSVGLDLDDPPPDVVAEECPTEKTAGDVVHASREQIVESQLPSGKSVG